MSKPSDNFVGNAKSIVGEVLGDGSLVEEGVRQKHEGDRDRSDKDDAAARKGPLRINDLT